MRRRLPPGVTLPTEHRWPASVRAGGLVLRPLSRTDERDWQAVRIGNIGWLSEWDATSPPGTGRAVTFAQMVARHRKAGRDDHSLPWVLAWDEGWPERPARDKEARMIGQVTVSGITFGSALMANIGYWIDRDQAGRGLMPAAIALATDYCFQVLGLHRVEINIRPENAPSLRVVQKLGFRDEGRRERLLHISGAWQDHASFAITTDEVPHGLLNRYLVGGPLPTARKRLG